jgi:predicted nucleic acid-binding protein
MEPGHRLIVPTVEDWEIAWLAYERGEAESAGIVDQVSFAIMRRLGISKAFSSDRHFRMVGFETLFCD